MSRAIKFRAWDKEKSRWVREYDYQLEKQGDPAYEKEYGEDSGWLDGEVASDLDLVNDRLTIDRYVWEQFTGLKDKNGREIYEGDILQNADGETATVVWCEETAEWGIEWSDCEVRDSLSWRMTCVKESDSLNEVIGNIHENPELL